MCLPPLLCSRHESPAGSRTLVPSAVAAPTPINPWSVFGKLEDVVLLLIKKKKKKKRARQPSPSSSSTPFSSSSFSSSSSFASSPPLLSPVGLRKGGWILPLPKKTRSSKGCSPPFGGRPLRLSLGRLPQYPSQTVRGLRPLKLVPFRHLVSECRQRHGRLQETMQNRAAPLL